MSKLKELKEKLNPKVALIGGVVVVSTSLGTCHLMGPGEAEEAPTELPAEVVAEPEAEVEPAPEAEE